MRRKLQPAVRYFAFEPKMAAAADDEAKRKRATKPCEEFTLEGIYRLLPGEQQLQWRGQFVPGPLAADDHHARAHAWTDCFAQVQYHANGLWSGRFFSERCLLGVQVGFVVCARARDAFYQCLVDELKPLFGVPALGTHSLYVCRRPGNTLLL